MNQLMTCRYLINLKIVLVYDVLGMNSDIPRLPTPKYLFRDSIIQASQIRVLAEYMVLELLLGLLPFANHSQRLCTLYVRA